jgi:hypothetical protein
VGPKRAKIDPSKTRLKAQKMRQNRFKIDRENWLVEGCGNRRGKFPHHGEQ